MVVVTPIPISTCVDANETASPKAVLATPTTLSFTLMEALVTSYKLNSVLIGLNVKSHPVVVGI